MKSKIDEIKAAYDRGVCMCGVVCAFVHACAVVCTCLYILLVCANRILVSRIFIYRQKQI